MTDHTWLGRCYPLLSDGGKCWSFEMCQRCWAVRLLKEVEMQACQADQFFRWDGKNECDGVAKGYR